MTTTDRVDIFVQIISLWEHPSAKKPPILATMTLALAALVPGTGGQTQASDDPPLSPETGWQVVDDFDGVQPSWHIPAQYSLRRKLAHRRTDHTARHGLRCEHIAVLAEKGDERIHATHPIPPSRAIGEFQASLWLCGNRPGFQLMARVRLPRTLDDESGAPLSVLVEGDAYTAAGTWQRLSLHHVDQRLEAKTRVLRAAQGPHVDPAEAYVDLIVLNVYGGAGINRVWVDDLLLTGAVPCRRVTPGHVQQAGFQTPGPALQVGVEHGLLRVHEHTLMPRIVTYRGEPFQLLAELGFNCIWLDRPADDAQLASARANNVWLICPAPDQPGDLEDFDRVLAWCIAQDSMPGELANLRSRARAIRARDARSRPLLLSARDGHGGSSRYVDIVVDTGPAAAASTSRSGLAMWRTVPLHGPDGDLAWQHVRNHAHEAIAAGYKGIVVSTGENLELRSSRHPRQLAELLNMELEVLQPWAVVNQFDAVQATSSEGGYTVSVLRNGLTQLALVRKYDETANVRATSPYTNVAIPLSRGQAAFLIETDRLLPLTARHIAGGVSVPLRGTPVSAKILFTDQSTVVQHLTQHLRRTESRAHELLLDVARDELLELDRMIGRAGRSDGDQAALRGRLHRLHGLLPSSAARGEQKITGRQLEAVFSELEDLRRTTRNR